MAAILIQTTKGGKVYLDSWVQKDFSGDKMSCQEHEAEVHYIAAIQEADWNQGRYNSKGPPPVTYSFYGDGDLLVYFFLLRQALIMQS